MTSKIFIKGNIAYSNEEKVFLIPQKIETLRINNDEKHLFETAKRISDFLEKQKDNNKEFKISGKFENFEKIKEKIEILEKEKLKKPEDSDYEFIEKTTQIEIIEQILTSIDETEIDEIKSEMELVLKTLKQSQDNRISTIEQQIEVENTKKTKILQAKKQEEKNILEPLREELKTMENRQKSLLEKEGKLSSLMEKKEDNGPENPYEIQMKIDKLQANIENNLMEISILENKISTLNERIKLGKKKNVSPLEFILTLGLIYWTPYSECRYQAGRLKLKILKLKEHNLKAKKKIYNFEKENEFKKKKNSEMVKQNEKKKEDIIRELNEINKENQKLNKNIESQRKEIEKGEKSLIRFDKDINEINERIIDLESVKEEVEKYNISVIENKFAELKKERVDVKIELEDYKKALQNQRVEIDGEWIIHL